MQFQEFLNRKNDLKNVPLLGTEAHLKMASADRKLSIKKDFYQSKNPKIAAVLVFLYPKNHETHMVFMQRNLYEGVHSNQISFPGGKFEEIDKTLENTALRESFEELGIRPEWVEIIKPLSEIYIPPSNFLVHPFLGFSTENHTFIPDIKEVSKVIELSLATILNDDILHYEILNTSYAKNIQVPVFKVDTIIIWGATAMILSEVKEIFKGIK